jgi:crotonobetainyl-CoA:carnitine CoA-transferase CaiB-like acyl-CoA transferase
LVKSALFESTVFLMGQHMAGGAVTGEEVPPMTARRGGWGIYQVFKTADDDQVFIGVTSDNHWRRFCDAFARPDLFADPRLATNEHRVAARASLIPIIAELLSQYTKADIIERCETASIPYALVAKVEDLFTDTHLNASGGLLDVTLPGDIRTKLPRLPIELSGARPGLRREAPRLGQHTGEVLAEIGIDEEEIAALERQRIIVTEKPLTKT